MVEIDFKKRVSELYVKYSFRASPVLDQYFIINPGVIERCSRYAELSKDDTVLEVGPGLGFLTEELSKKAGKVIAVEADKKLETLLKSEFSNKKNVEFIFEDFLKIKTPKFNKIVSNIPYSISAPLTFRLLEYDFDKAVLFYQKEFGEKMLSEPGDHEYGRLSVMTQYYFDIEIKETVPKNYFYPQPKVDSCIIVLKRKKIERDRDFDNFVREIFRYKNKNVSNSVKMGVGKEIVDDRKTDYLSVEEVKELYKKVKEL